MSRIRIRKLEQIQGPEPFSFSTSQPPGPSLPGSVLRSHTFLSTESLTDCFWIWSPSWQGGQKLVLKSVRGSQIWRQSPEVRYHSWKLGSLGTFWFILNSSGESFCSSCPFHLPLIIPPHKPVWRKPPVYTIWSLSIVTNTNEHNSYKMVLGQHSS